MSRLNQLQETFVPLSHVTDVFMLLFLGSPVLFYVLYDGRVLNAVSFQGALHAVDGNL